MGGEETPRPFFVWRPLRRGGREAWASCRERLWVDGRGGGSPPFCLPGIRCGAASGKAVHLHSSPCAGAPGGARALGGGVIRRLVGLNDRLPRLRSAAEVGVCGGGGGYEPCRLVVGIFVRNAAKGPPFLTVKRLHILCIALLASVALAAPAFGARGSSTQGSAAFSFVHYEADREDDEDFEATSFTQQYSVLHTREGRLSGGRLGQYTLALGAEWSLADVDIDGRGYDLDTFKVLYNGSLLVAPGGLPFRLHAYSRDAHGSTWITDSEINGNNRQQGLQGLPEGPVIDPDVVTDISNGQHIHTGVLLVVGIRNGSYRGSYRDLLSKFPRLLVDYKETSVRNLESLTPTKYRQRDLAFVSLNKKNNWFHFRVKDFEDYLESGRDSQTKQVMLGTIDHVLRRHWINLTNWIKVSVDGSFTEHLQESIGTGVTERYDFNLFGRARRAKWDLSNLNTFSRSMQDEQITRSIDIPVLLQGEVDRNTSYRLRVAGAADDATGGIQDDRRVETLNAAAQVETFRQDRYTLTSELAGEVKQGTESKGYSVKAKMAVRSNHRYDPKYDVSAEYSVKRFAGTDLSGDDVGFWEHQVAAGVATELSPTLRTEITQDFVYGTGAIQGTISNVISASSTTGLSRSEDLEQDIDGDLFKSATSWAFDHSTSRRMDNRFVAKFEFLSYDDSQTQTTLQHNLTYRGRRLTAKMVNEVAFGDALKSSGGGYSSNNVRRSHHHSASMDYSPGRAWQAGVSFDYDKDIADDGEAYDLEADQTGRYSLYTINGVVRKLAQVEERLRYVKTDGQWTGEAWGSEFSLVGSYYPTKQTLLRAIVKYQLGTAASDTDYQEVAFGLSAGVNFEKLQAEIEYQYGTRDLDDDGLVNRNSDEQRLEVTVKKVF